MNRLPDWARRGLRTFAQAFAGIFALSLLGWLGDVSAWASCSVDCEAFPEVTVLGKAAIAAAAGAAAAAVSALVNFAEDHSRVPALLKSPPSAGRNPAPDTGSVSVLLVARLVPVLVLAAAAAAALLAS